MIYEPSEDSFLLAKYVDKFAKGKILDIGRYQKGSHTKRPGL